MGIFEGPTVPQPRQTPMQARDQLDNLRAAGYEPIDPIFRMEALVDQIDRLEKKVDRLMAHVGIDG